MKTKLKDTVYYESPIVTDQTNRYDTLDKDAGEPDYLELTE